MINMQLILIRDMLEKCHPEDEFRMKCDLDFDMRWAKDDSVAVICPNIHVMENMIEDIIEDWSPPATGKYHYDGWQEYRDTYVAFEKHEDALRFITEYDHVKIRG